MRELLFLTPLIKEHIGQDSKGKHLAIVRRFSAQAGHHEGNDVINGLVVQQEAVSLRVNDGTAEDVKGRE